ncbi:hypothetical protein ED92_40060 [Amycolatopsis sp. MJM2582]|uniref:alkene reductase n=1 Tax=Amycolatopsis TaxID=1813 RepID=UPI000502AD47|nr:MULTISPECIES: alkene reductase [unclassified Amycolatopsis]KFZ76890.1 hypothetical protein ED92_40060 [Amycolatopsis sp. MJM2582]RSN39542.1 alkene reductase [Amycolatopsis sp. WAC 04197]
MKDLFDEVEVGGIVAPNRLVMSPMGRCRATVAGHPSEHAPAYYAQRASAGLIISESTHPNWIAQGHPNCPHLHTEEHVRHWRRVTDEVHAAGGRFLVQLAHSGRIGHPSLRDGHLPVAPSAIRPAGQASTYQGKRDYVTPRALRPDEIAATVQDFASAARAAIRAGFDGVELHGANGYLLHQFLADRTNKRVDRYGGTPANRVRFVREVAEAVGDAIGAGRVGIRLSPRFGINDMAEGDAERIYSELIDVLSSIGLAYVHLVVGSDPAIARMIRRRWPSTLIVNPGTGELGTEPTLRLVRRVLDEGADLIAFGRQFLANPDLPYRLRNAAELNPPDPETFYGGDARGYTDYPTLAPTA